MTPIKTENHWYLVDAQAGLYVCGYCGCLSIDKTTLDDRTGLEIHRQHCPEDRISRRARLAAERLRNESKN